MTRLTRKKPVDAIKEKIIDVKSSTIYSRPVALKEKRLNASKNARYLFSAGELQGGQRRDTDSVWSLKVYGIERTLVNEGELVIYYLKDRPKREFLQGELQIVSSWSRVSSWRNSLIKKKSIKKVSFSINPSNSGKSTQETDKDMNNKMIAYLANPTDKEDAANKQCVDKTKNNQKQSIYLFLVKIYRRSLFIETLIKEKATCWYHIDHNSNNEVCYYNNVSVNCFRSIRIELPRNTKKLNFNQTKNINFTTQGKTIFLLP